MVIVPVCTRDGPRVVTSPMSSWASLLGRVGLLFSSPEQYVYTHTHILCLAIANAIVLLSKPLSYSHRSQPNCAVNSHCLARNRLIVVKCSFAMSLLLLVNHVTIIQPPSFSYPSLAMKGDVEKGGRVERGFNFFSKFLEWLKLKWFIIMGTKIKFKLPYEKGDMALRHSYHHLSETN